ncbi:MAG: class I SAM-dependent methyltransferase [Promethearchaeota archaeon]|jgi:ubiquinone/menaquinone biosynthesis C-methylase UbiE
MRAEEFLEKKLKEEELYFGKKSREYYNSLVNSWMNDNTNSKHRFDTIQTYLQNAKKILDMGSGCGTFMFYGLIHEYDMYGIDPSKWKFKFNEMKAKEYSYPSEWINRINIGYGENLPFEDNSFDCVSTYQTLEHVQKLDLVLKEMLRVIKSEGAIHLKFPDYGSTFEAHYLVPWLPFFPRRLAKIYLRLLKKPVLGLETLQYITRNGIIKRISKICKKKSSWKIKIIDVKRVKVEKELKKRKIPRLSGITYFFYLCFEYLRSLFRNEISCDLFIYIKKH